MRSQDVWYAIPSVNPVRCREAFAKWKAQGYKVAVLVEQEHRSEFEADLVLVQDSYRGYYHAVNKLAKALPHADIIVTGGDDISPDPNKTAQQLAEDFYQRFPDGFGVMQPVGDDLPGTRNICGSPWFGREWIRRSFQGRGPMPPAGYIGFYGDEELKNVAEMLGVLWQREDATQYHYHWSRQGGPGKLPYQEKNDRHWVHDQTLFAARRDAGWPTARPLARFHPKGPVVVTGAGGFIGHHLVKRLVAEGCVVRAIDIKEPEYEESPAEFFYDVDLRAPGSEMWSFKDADVVFHLAADMGGIGFIEANRANCARNNALIDINVLDAAVKHKISRLLYTSSACAYPVYLQRSPEVTPLAESQIHPYDPEPGYGEQKLYTERLCKYYSEDFGLSTRIARLHNIYGPLGTYDGGREKAPAAFCRKVAQAPAFGPIGQGQIVHGPVDVWGDGQQTRSFCYVDDCVEGLIRLMNSDVEEPLNIGTDELVTIDELVGLVACAAKKAVTLNHVPGPLGVAGRNADLTLVKKLLDWQPAWKLRDGLDETYPWIAGRLAAGGH